MFLARRSLNQHAVIRQSPQSLFLNLDLFGSSIRFTLLQVGTGSGAHVVERTKLTNSRADQDAARRLYLGPRAQTSVFQVGAVYVFESTLCYTMMIFLELTAFLALATTASAQWGHGWKSKHSMSPSSCSASPTASYSPFSYTVETSTRYATSVSSPLALTTSYAPPFSEASSLLPTNIKYTSYSLNRNSTALHDGEYGQGAYARLWSPLSYNTTVPFTTTMSPTPVASSELVYPPALYTACPQYADACLDCYKLPKDFIWGVAGSAFQIEGGLTEAGRGPSDIDVFGALPNTNDEANAVVADMNYYLYKVRIAFGQVHRLQQLLKNSGTISKTLLGSLLSGFHTIRSRFRGQE